MKATSFRRRNSRSNPEERQNRSLLNFNIGGKKARGRLFTQPLSSNPSNLSPPRWPSSKKGHPLAPNRPSLPKKGPRPKHHFDVLKETIPRRVPRADTQTYSSLRNRDTTRNVLFPCESVSVVCAPCACTRDETASQPAAVTLARRHRRLQRRQGRRWHRLPPSRRRRRRRRCCRS